MILPAHDAINVAEFREEYLQPAIRLVGTIDRSPRRGGSRPGQQRAARIATELAIERLPAVFEETIPSGDIAERALVQAPQSPRAVVAACVDAPVLVDEEFVPE